SKWAASSSLLFQGEYPRLRGGVICNGIPYEAPVIPAKAGIQSEDSAFPKACGVDSRFRGNDRGLERPCLPNDTTTPARPSAMRPWKLVGAGPPRARTLRTPPAVWD